MKAVVLREFGASHNVPAILGREAAGEVVEVGPDTSGWKAGDRAATLQRLSCGECALCRSGHNSLCRKDARFFGGVRRSTEKITGGMVDLFFAGLVVPGAANGEKP
jgi:threonine dehydrogenase-like Zn-dependent dehydrogenase